MRRPFIFFLLILSLYCWLKDLINFLFYFFNLSGHYKDTLGTAAGILGVFLCLYIVKSRIYKDPPTQAIKDLLCLQRRKEWLLILFVSMPVIILGLYRSIYPDQNFDTLHFELYLQEFDLKENKINFSAGSLRTYYFPLAERIFGLFRHALGYRMGTFFNTFLLLTLVASVYDLLKKFFSSIVPDLQIRAIWLALLALYVVFADNMLFNVGSYKPDLIGVPLLLELLHIVLFPDKQAKAWRHFYFFLVASLIIAFKLTYLPHVAILLFIYYYKNYKSFRPAERFGLPLSLLLFPGIYMLYSQIETGNPIFPFFNKIFHSPLYPYANFKDERWGPRSIYEFIAYPFITFMDNARCSEFSLFSIRLLFGYAASWVAVLYYWWMVRKTGGKNKITTDPVLRYLFYVSVLALLFDYSCLATTGYYRYSIIVEVLYGLVLVSWLIFLRHKPLAAAAVYFLIFSQSYVTFKNIYVDNRNLSWHNYSELLHHNGILGNNAALLLHDHGKINDPSGILPRIDGFVSMDPFPMDGVARLLKRNVPIYDLYFSGRNPDSIRAFEARVVRPMTETKTMVEVAGVESLGDRAVEALNRKGYLVTNMKEIYPDFMKYGEPLFLLQIKYLDTARYNIKYTEKYLRDENPAESRNDLSFRSSNRLVAIVREAPFAFNWSFLPKDYSIIINGRKYISTDDLKGDKALVMEGDSLTIHKSNEVPYMIMIQEIEKKP